MKKCSKCKEVKDLSEFGKDKNKKDKHSYTCKICRTENDYKRKNVLKNFHLTKKYGITLEEYNNLFFKQNGCCDICKKHQSEFKISLSVDHCHETGNIRGLLCSSCNRALGMYKESEEILLNAIKYIKKFGVI